MTPRALTPKLSIAPMMEYTYRHFRVFMRSLTSQTLLYTEMVTVWALLNGDKEHLLSLEALEHPISLQLGGVDPVMLAESARIAAGFGYDEINLNVGCPSDKVQRGRFGAQLMREPEAVARAVEAMRAAVDLPVTVKHRIGVDELDAYEDMLRFVDIVSAGGADRLTVHARKAWLKGLSPKENRDVPPLRWAEVHRLKIERPALQIEINGGIRSLDVALEHLEAVDGVMIGRAAYEDPYIFAEADQRVFGVGKPAISRVKAVERYLPYIERMRGEGVSIHWLIKPLHHLFNGQPGARGWRHALGSAQASDGPERVEAALRPFQTNT